MTILVLAYSISPIRGSEYSVGWNYVKEMSRYHNLIVLYGLAGSHLGDLQEIEGSELCKNLEAVEFIPVRPSRLARLLNTPNRNGVLVYSFYLAYRVWHWQAYQKALKLIGDRKIDLIHYLCPIGFREPGYLWKIDRPYIWGPIGGIKNRPIGIIINRNLVMGLKALLRNAVNTLQFRFSKRLRQALRRCDLLLVATSEMKQLLKTIHGVDAITLPENAITGEMLSQQRIVSLSTEETLNIIWVGTIDERKSLDILLSALARIGSKNWHLDVVGKGPLQSKLQALARKCAISDRVTWVGHLPREEVEKHYRKAHVHVITSMAEANTTVIWEAMSFGVPTITLDHCGMHDTVCDTCGIKIPVRTISEITHELASAINDILDNPSRIESLSHGVKACSFQYSWNRRCSDWQRIYRMAIEKWSSNKVEAN
jgi:glycosyltransferase involved in cell wall biosynthesis